MSRTLKSGAAVAVATALEGLQQPICLLLTFVAVESTILVPLVQLFSFGEGGRLARDSGLAILLVAGVLLAAFISGSTLAREISSGTVAAAVSKPVPRWVFLLGKFAGAALVVLLFCWIETIAILLAERSSEHYLETETMVGHIRDTRCGLLAMAAPVLALAKAAFVNWRFRWRFGLWFFVFLAIIQTLLVAVIGLFGRDGAWLGFGGHAPALDFRIVPAAALIAMLLGIFCALATALSTRLQTGAAVAASFAVLFVGFLADRHFGGAAGALPRLLYAVVPDVQHFWVVDSLAGGGAIPWRYLVQAGAYALSYMAFVLTLGAISFQRRDLG
ncbi:MAG: hypothetical protein ACOX9C_08865 [Kiritimatiellia bacterium]